MSVPRQPCNNNKNMVWMIGSLVHNQTNRLIKTMYRKLFIVICVQLHKNLTTKTDSITNTVLYFLYINVLKYVSCALTG